MEDFLSFLNFSISVDAVGNLVCDGLLNKNEDTLFFEKYDGKFNCGMEKDKVVEEGSLFPGRLCDCSVSLTSVNDCFVEFKGELEEGEIIKC